MQQLIPISDNNGKQVVSARDLYQYLGLDFSNWRRWTLKNIEGNDFAVVNEDWVGFVTMTNGNQTTDYALSMDFAKRLSMMARTEKGEAARRYFIECEQRANITTPQLPATYAQALRELAETVEAKALLDAKLLEAAPKIEFYDAVTDSKDAIPMGDVAKVLDMGIGRNKLFQLLRDVKVLMENLISS